MRFVLIGGPYGDCTSSYEIKFEAPYTVRDLIEKVLSRHEWGYIGIHNKNKFSVFGDPECEYKDNKIITNPIPEEYMDKVIVKCKASGGWTRMDYLIYLE